MSETRAGHYSPSMKVGSLVFTSGVLPILNRETKETPSSIEEQCLLVLNRIEEIIGKYDLTRNDIVKTTVFISNGDDWATVNEVYYQFFGDHKPTRSIIPVSELHYGCKIEIEAIASARN
jgi:2-iminobutanoate/2-iminopropanoate deaminase